MNIWNVKAFWMAGNKCIVHICEMVKLLFFLYVNSSLRNATNVFQTYDTLQVVFIVSTFIQLSTHSPFFPKNVSRLQHNYLRK